MKTALCVAAIMVGVGPLADFAPQNPPPVTAGQPAGGQTGRGAAPQQAAPTIPSISQRPTGGSLSMIRLGAADSRIWFGWRVAIPATAFKALTFSDALAKSDLLGVAGVEASSTQL